MNEKRKSYPSDVSDEEWNFCVNYLTLMEEDAPQREHSLRSVFNALRYLIRWAEPGACCPTICRPGTRFTNKRSAGSRPDVSKPSMAQDLRAVLRLALERKADPSAVILDSRTVQSTPESGARAGFDGHKKRKGSKVH